MEQVTITAKIQIIAAETGLWQLQSLWFEKTLITTLFFCQIFDFYLLYGVVWYDTIVIGADFYETLLWQTF